MFNISFNLFWEYDSCDVESNTEPIKRDSLIHDVVVETDLSEHVDTTVSDFMFLLIIHVFFF